MVDGLKSASQLSRELGINKNSVCRCVNEYREKHGIKSSERTERAATNREDKACIKALEKALREKEEELAILKKAVAIFSKTKD